MSGTATNSPLPFKGGDQGVGQARWGLDAPGGALFAAAESLLGAGTRAPTPFPSLEREGL
jgi:hypothetical protein